MEVRIALWALWLGKEFTLYVMYVLMIFLKLHSIKIALVVFMQSFMSVLSVTTIFLHISPA